MFVAVHASPSISSTCVTAVLYAAAVFEPSWPVRPAQSRKTIKPSAVPLIWGSGSVVIMSLRLSCPCAMIARKGHTCNLY